MESGSTVDITVLKPNDMIAAPLRFDEALNVDLKEFQTPSGGAEDSKSPTNFERRSNCTTFLKARRNCSQIDKVLFAF